MIADKKPVSTNEQILVIEVNPATKEVVETHHYKDAKELRVKLGARLRNSLLGTDPLNLASIRLARGRDAVVFNSAEDEPHRFIGAHGTSKQKLKKVVTDAIPLVA